MINNNTIKHITETASLYNEFYLDRYECQDDFDDKFEESIEDFESIEELLEAFMNQAECFATVIRMHNEEKEAHFTFKDGEINFDVYNS